MIQKEQKAIIIGSLLSIIIFVLFILMLIKYIYPNILDIENNKTLLSEKLKEYEKLESKGFDFNEFKELNSLYNPKEIKYENNEEVYKDKELYNILNEEFYKKIYKNFYESFYNNSLYNGDYESFVNTDISFISYLQKLDRELEQVRNSEKFNNKKTNLFLVLPKYSSYIELDSKESLTDLEFINSVETLLKKFNLRTVSPIGVKSIVPFENDIINSKDYIYYIPLELNIVGTKIGIIDFLEYIKDSGSIEFGKNDFDFKYDNSEISQLVEVDKFESKKYIDSSLNKRSFEDFGLKTFLLKTGQKDDIISVIIGLNFYVSGIGLEKTISEINSIIGDNITKIKEDKYGNLVKDEETGEYTLELLHYNYNNILKVVRKLNGNIKLKKDSYYSKKVNNIFLYLNNKNLKQDIKEIKKEIKQTDNLNDIHLKVLKYKDIFSKIDQETYSIVQSLGINKDKIYPKNYVFE